MISATCKVLDFVFLKESFKKLKIDTDCIFSFLFLASKSRLDFYFCLDPLESFGQQIWVISENIEKFAVSPYPPTALQSL